MLKTKKIKIYTKKIDSALHFYSFSQFLMATFFNGQPARHCEFPPAHV